MRERIQKLRVVRDHHAGLRVIAQKFSEMLNPLFVKIVGWLVKQKQIRILDERGRKQQPRLLASGKR